MKISLALILCSYVANSCLPPYVYPEQFDSQYECFMKGYEESIIKMKEIGKEDVNKHQFYIRFLCSEQIEIREKQET